MPAEPYADPAAYSIRTGRAGLTEDESVQVATLLADASAIMRARVGDLDERLDAGTLERIVAEGVCVRMVQRFLANPDAAQSRSDTSGPFASSKTWAVVSGRTGLYLTDSELADLTPSAEGGISSIGTVRVGLVTSPNNDRVVRRWRL